MVSSSARSLQMLFVRHERRVELTSVSLLLLDSHLLQQGVPIDQQFPKAFSNVQAITTTTPSRFRYFAPHANLDSLECTSVGLLGAPLRSHHNFPFSDLSPNNHGLHPPVALAPFIRVPLLIAHHQLPLSFYASVNELTAKMRMSERPHFNIRTAPALLSAQVRAKRAVHRTLGREAFTIRPHIGGR